MPITSRLRPVVIPATLGLLAGAACGGSGGVQPSPAASLPAARSSIEAVLNYQACPKNGKNDVRTQLPKAANAPDLAIVDTHIMGEPTDIVRVGVIYTYNGGVKHQVVFDYRPASRAVTGEDSISTAVLDQLKAGCR